MKTKISRIGKKSLSVIIALMMIVSTMLVGMVSVNAANDPTKAEFYLVGQFTGSNWNSDKTKYKIENNYSGSNVIFYYDVEGTDLNGKWFAICNSSGSRYAPSTSEAIGIGQSNKKSGTYNESNSWQYTGSATKIRICVDQRDSTSDNMYYPYVWVEEISESTKYTVSKGTETNGTFSVSSTSAAEGDTVTVTTSPSNGYEVDTVTYTLDGGSATTISGSNNTYTFTMPAANVTVNVSFKATSTPSTTYYLGGRIKQDGTSSDWLKTDNTDYPFVATETAGLYKYVSKQTPADWSKTVTYLQYFYVHTGSGNPWYGSQPDSDSDAAVLTSAGQTITLQEYSKDTGTDVTRLTYINSTDTTGNVIFYLDTNDGMKLYYEVEGSSTTTGAFTITDKTALNGSLSFSADGKKAGTADAGDTVNVTAKPASGFTCSGITVTYTNATTSETVTLESTGSGNSYTFDVPAELTTAEVKKQEIAVKATFTLDKSAYIATQGDGLWIDVAPDESDSTATLIKWNNYTGNSHSDRGSYIFYVPKNVDLTNANIYNGYGSAVTLNGTSIPADGTAVVSLAKDTSYSTSGGVSTSVKVMQGSTDAMFLYTTDKNGNSYNLPTKTDSSLTSKSTVKSSGGSCKTMVSGETSATFSSAIALESVKGRGNSSWEASYKLFGKYAFNMKLSSKTKLFGMDGAKSWCLLANNADESMLRNALTFQLAAEIGIQDTPEFRFVDIYDNGEYMGAYLVTEKVDVGSSKLVKGESFDDINEETIQDIYQDDTKTVDETKIKTDTYTYNGSTYKMSYATVDSQGTSSYPTDTRGKYLLEFEIASRYDDETSYFQSPRGQYVVVKSPEFATKEQVTYIAQKFAAMEELVFTSGATKAQLSTVMDLESFAKMYLIQEFSSNLDSAATSYYITFDCAQSDPVFVANPVWDYDWAYGQYRKDEKESVTGSGVSSPLDTDNPQAWYAKTKKMGDDQKDDYSIQSQLANNNSAFKSEVRKAWEGTNGFYATVQKYFGDNSQIDTWYTQIKDSVNMNETRWGFIASDPLKTADWGSKDTGSTHEAAVNYLENTWTSVRASWLNGKFTDDSEYAPYTPSKPTIAAYNADQSAEITEVSSGTDFVIKVTSSIESGVKYRLYEGSSTGYLENSDGIFILNVTEAGTKTYTVKAVYGTTESEASDSVSVTVVAAVDISGVTLSVSKADVNVNEEFTLTATATPAGVTGVTYTFYKGSTAIAIDVTSNTLKTKLTAEGSAEYTVTAKANGITVTSTAVTVTATKVAQVHDFTVYFKCASAPAYKPYVSLDGATAVAMTQGTELGKNYAGTLTFYWYSYTFNVDSADTHTLTFTSKKTKLNATITDNFAYSEYYLAVDNLMTGTEVVDLTGSLEYVRNFFHSATNMVYSGVGTDGTLGFTNIDGERYKMGTVVNTDGTLTFSVKSATTMQMLTAELTTVSDTQKALLDVDLDGKVDIKDATLMQRALVS